MNKLKDHILAKQAILGATDSGRNWCLKALHPSDPLTEVLGIPDEDCVPTAFVNYQSTFTINAPVGLTTPAWKFDACLIPHPIGQMYVRTASVDDAVSFQFNHLNPQISGATHSDKFTSFCASYERWRLAYMAVTVYQDAPALANQGTIVVCQPPVQPRRVNLGMSTIPYTDPTRAPACCMPHLDLYDQYDFPEYDRSQSMPNSYFARSDAGCYVPLKLTTTCQRWHSTDEAVMVAGDNRSLIPNELPILQRSGAVVILGVPTLADLPPAGAFPFPSLCPATRVNTVSVSGRTSTAMVVGETTSDMCNDVWAHISARNLSPSCNYSFFVRAGYEVQVCPSSQMSPQLRLSPPSDELALKHYFSIARELKDGYPADYNDLGKLWEVIKNAANAVLPAVKAMPVIGPIATAFEPGMRAGIGALEKALKSTSKRDKPPLAAVTRAQVALRQPTTSAQPARRRPRKRKPGKRRVKPNYPRGVPDD